MSKYGDLIRDDAFPGRYKKWISAGITEDILDAAEEFAQLAPDRIDDNGTNIEKAALARFYAKGARDMLVFLRSFSSLEDMQKSREASSQEMEFGYKRILEQDKKGLDV